MDPPIPVLSSPFNSFSQRFPEHSHLSRTPSRRQQFTDHEINPLLSNLSPSSTLEALAVTDAVPTGKRHRQSFIQQSVASASTYERAWGIKAALAGKKLREWFEELSGWPWPGYEGKDCQEEEHWGSLPAKLLREYEERIEVIRDDMETLEVEDLKNYVRNTHLRSSARRTSVSAPSDYEHLDDFTAIITAIIFQALPTLSRLTTLLSIWTTRLMILRRVPTFVRDLGDAQESLLSAWIAVGKTDASTVKRRAAFSREASRDIQAVLQEQISHLGRRLDNMLDLLEGSRDTLPESWIDTMDSLENEYSSWVVRAEKLVLHNEMDTGSGEDRTVRSEADLGSDGITPFDVERSSNSLDADPQIKSIPLGAESESDGVRSRPSPEVVPQGDIANNFATRSLEDRAVIAKVPLSDHPSSPHVQPEEMTQYLHHGPAFNKTRNSPDPSKHRPAPLVLGDRSSIADSTASSDMSSDISYPGSATSDYFSNKSSPEVYNASVVEYVGTPALVANPWSSREPVTPLDIISSRSSLQTEPGGAGSFQTSASSGILSPNSQRSRASTFVPETTVGRDLELPRDETDGQFSTKQHVRTRSASMQSFEVIPKNEIRRIMVQRSESYSSAPSGPHREVEAELVINDTSSSQVQGQMGLRDENLPTLATDSREDRPQKNSVQSILEPELQAPVREESRAAPKSSHRFQQVMDLGPGSTPVKIRRKPLQTPSEPERVQKMSPDDQLEAQISSILTQIPAHIRLTSGPEPDAPEVTRFSAAPKTPTSRRPALRFNRAQTSVTPPTMTLAPAQPKSFKSRSQNGEPEIKLYHLHQSGKDVPIKLFVRLVGEAGERVMVRIGGGWADLAEYLKEYASHHGRRSVSDSRFDIQGIPSSPSSQKSSSRPGSPTSSKASPAIPFRRQHTTLGQYESPQTPVSDPLLRTSSRVSWNEEDSPSLGLAGPKTKKVEISPRKQAWVDEILGQARGGNGGAAIGDMGKVGGTQRVFFKGRSRTGSNV